MRTTLFELPTKHASAFYIIPLQADQKDLPAVTLLNKQFLSYTFIDKLYAQLCISNSPFYIAFCIKIVIILL